jgi:hypothetical protein
VYLLGAGVLQLVVTLDQLPLCRQVEETWPNPESHTPLQTCSGSKPLQFPKLAPGATGKPVQLTAIVVTAEQQAYIKEAVYTL